MEVWLDLAVSTQWSSYLPFSHKPRDGDFCSAIFKIISFTLDLKHVQCKRNSGIRSIFWHNFSVPAEEQFKGKSRSSRHCTRARDATAAAHCYTSTCAAAWERSALEIAGWIALGRAAFILTACVRDAPQIKIGHTLIYPLHFRMHEINFRACIHKHIFDGASFCTT